MTRSMAPPTASSSRAGSTKHGALADKAALGLQPIWSSRIPSRSHSPKSAAKSEERIGQILGELGLKR